MPALGKANIPFQFMGAFPIESWFSHGRRHFLGRFETVEAVWEA
jgi:hypothetical protein